MSDPLAGLSDFQHDWVTAQRPVLLVDEVRQPEPGSGREFVTYVFLETNTGLAYGMASASAGLRVKHLDPGRRETVYKGSDLYGGRQRSSHDFLRAHVQSSVSACPHAYLLTTSNEVLRRYETIAPGGINTVPAPGGPRGPAIVAGRELVPLMNAVKVVATERAYGAVQVDILLDRSKHLGMSAKQRALGPGDFEIFGPVTLNEQRGGAPAALQCPTAFRFIAGDDKGGFRDLLLLPDAVAYVLHLAGRLEVGVEAVRRGRDFDIREVVTPSIFAGRQT